MSNHLGRVSLAKYQDPLPLYSLGFVGLRSLILSTLCIVLGLTYMMILSNKEKLIDNQLKTITQNVQLEFSAVEKAQIFTTPETAIKKIEQKLKQAKNDIKKVNRLNQVSALIALKGLQTAILGTPCLISNYESFDDNTGQFQIAECDNENSQKISNVLSKQNIKFKIKSMRDNQIEGIF